MARVGTHGDGMTFGVELPHFGPLASGRGKALANGPGSSARSCPLDKVADVRHPFNSFETR